MPGTIRFVTRDDAEAIRDIYAPYVTSSLVTFETNVQRVYDLQRRIGTISAVTPFLVCEIDGKVAGFSYADSKKQIGAFDWNTDVHVYIDDDYQKCNIASALYLAMISLLTELGYRKLVSVVAASDDASESFHLAFGFRKVGLLENSAWKLGKWHSVVIYEKLLDASGTEPAPTRQVTDLDEDFCEKKFRQCEKIIKIK